MNDAMLNTIYYQLSSIYGLFLMKEMRDNGLIDDKTYKDGLHMQFEQFEKIMETSTSRYKQAAI